MDDVGKRATEGKHAEEERQYRIFLLKPQVVRLACIEHEHFDKLIKKGESEGKSKSDLTALWVETVNRRDAHKRASGLIFSPPLEFTRAHKSALVRFFRDLRGFTWSSNFGWVGQTETLNRPQIDAFEAAPSLYEGIVTGGLVRCGSGGSGAVEDPQPSSSSSPALVGFNMDGIGLDGSLPQNISLFDQCSFLNMNWNLICGHLPRNFGHLVNLTSINLSGNLLTGVLDSDSFSRLTALTHLDLSFNDFTGPIPDIFSFVIKLKVLNLSGNRLVGELPDSLSQLSDLEELRLYNNDLVGEILPGLGGLKKLTTVNLSQNGFTKGANVFNSCSKLVSLQLQHNQLKGRLDNSLSGMRRLEVLYLQDNMLSGLLPDTVCSLSRLRRLNLSRNSFRGLIPFNIGNLSRLESLLLTDNSFVGPVPLSLAELKCLRDFHVFRSYPSEFAQQPLAFNREEFERLYVFAPSYGINSLHWDYKQVYGRDREPGDDDSVTLFSGTL